MWWPGTVDLPNVGVENPRKRPRNGHLSGVSSGEGRANGHQDGGDDDGYTPSRGAVAAAIAPPYDHHFPELFPFSSV
ncbi:unnamed protein product [Spirodela intermedia]|uniref:Uncharacterized protein n=1 Tax=Spirodela intermedia TaxID=51605 RepID=A0A7I8L6X1_SPIIN|nr:unnamed protein product [Spirodela intermedia]